MTIKTPIIAQITHPLTLSHAKTLCHGCGNVIATPTCVEVEIDPLPVVHTEALPPETGSCESSSTLDYSRVRLNGADFLLPSRAQLHILDANSTDMENSTVYSACHEFLGESTLRFDSGPELEANSPNQSSGAADLPAGVPFTIALTNNIDQTNAAAGDKIAAKLTAAIVDAQHHVLAPKGTVVTARIVQVRRFYEPAPSLRLVIKLETMDIAGTGRPLLARPDSRVPVSSVGSNALRRRGPLTTTRLDNQDPQAAVFTFWDTSGSLVAASGFESKWLTAAR
jgi:hypothetical protein